MEGLIETTAAVQEVGDDRPWPPLHLFPVETEPESEEPPLESDQHLWQIFLLLHCLRWVWRDRSDFYAAGNLTIYYSPRQRKSEDFRGPDFFVVLGVEPRPRKSWVVWQEGGLYPNVIIELLSDSTARVDRTEKRQLYQEVFRTPEYFWFDPQTGEEFVGLRLNGGRYEPIVPNDRGWLWSEQLGLFLGRDGGKLRWFSAEGEVIPEPRELAERAITEVQQARDEVQQARDEVQQAQAQLSEEQARRRRLAMKLRALGIDPEDEA